MKRRNSGNNGYIGINEAITPEGGIISTDKIYNTKIRELPYYQFGNTANTFGLPAGNYQRPSEWASLPDITAGSQQIAALFAVYNNESNVCALRVYGNYQVNWGDGTSNTYASGTVATKIYNEASYAGLTSAVFRNYKTVVVTVTPQAGATFTDIHFAIASGSTGSTGYRNVTSRNWLDIKMSAPNATTVSFSGWAGNATPLAYCPLLEQIEFIGTAPLTSISFIDARSLRRIISFPSTRLVTNWQSIFYGCNSLQEIPRSCLDGLLTGNATIHAYTFYYCFSLLSLPIDKIDMRSSTSAVGMFNNCFNLRRVPQFINSSNVTNFSASFSSCYRLEEIPEFDTTKNTTFYATFWQNHSLFKLQNSFAGASATNFGYMFYNCANLRQLPSMNTTNGTSFNDFIRDCYSLETIPQYDYSKATDLTRFAYNSINIKYLPDMNTTSALTNMNSAFYNCQNLINAPGITTPNVTNITSLFDSCLSLKTIPAYDMSKVTTSTTPFTNTYSLTSVGMTGISFSCSFANSIMGPTALNALYTSLATVGVSGANARTLTVTGNWGFTASNRAIAIGKGWSVT